MNEASSGPIQRLPVDVAAKILATSKITSLSDVIIGLVENSLDANATNISVEVDFHLGNCAVEDDGQGIEPINFLENGKLGCPNYSSKLKQKNVYGTSGNFLFNLSTVSLLTIASRHANYLSCNSVVLHNSRQIARYTPAPNHHSLSSDTNGARVIVRDLFGNLPLRVKHRAYSVQCQADVDRLMCLLRTRLLRLVLALNCSVRISLRDTRGSKLVAIGEKNTTPFPSKFSLKRTLSVLSQAQLVEPDTWAQWIPASLTSKRFAVKGAISLAPGLSRKVQFISIGIRPLSPDSEFKELYTHVNKLFKDSAFSVSEIRSTQLSDTFETPKVKPQRSFEKWPMFVFSLMPLQPASTTAGSSTADVTIEHIKATLTVLITQWLEVNLFRPGKVLKKSYRHSPSGNWTESVLQSRTPERGESSDKKNTGNDAPTCIAERRQSEPPFAPTNISDSTFSVPPSEFERDQRISGEETGRLTPAPQAADPEERNLQRPWSDTDAKALILSRSQAELGLEHNQTERYRQIVRQFRKVASGKLRANHDRRNETWVGKFLDNWKNPVFQPSLVPNITDNQFNMLPVLSKFFTSSQVGNGVFLQSQNISRSELEKCRVLGQLDQKFILAVSSGNTAQTSVSHQTLLAVDQHAADERVKVEDLFCQLYTTPEHSTDRNGGSVAVVGFTALSPPLTLSITNSEASRLASQSDYFESWGIKLTLSQNQVIVERCRREPNLVLDVIRAEAWRREDFEFSFEGTQTLDDGNRERSEQNQDFARQKEWISRIGKCPKGLLNLINSRACRSAIMFNDELELEQCQSLIWQLAQCVLPFQCAHGRPSMVPLIRFEKQGAADRSEEVYARGGLVLWEGDTDRTLTIERAWRKRGDEAKCAKRDTGKANADGEISPYFP